jgi:serine/threonine protein kinase
MTNIKSNFIAEGKYGCVITPAFDCKNKKIINNSVAKLFNNKINYNYELYIYNKIKEIDKNNLFTVEKLDNCKINKQFINSNVDNFDKCSLIKNKVNYQIIYEYGGIDLLEYIIKNKTIDVKLLFKNFNDIIKGLLLLDKNNIIHNDIKLNNILFNNNKLFLIDFGLAIFTNDLFNNSNLINKLDLEHLLMPLDIKLYGLSKFKLLKNTTKLNTLLFIDYVNKLINSYPNYFISNPKYYNEIIKLNLSIQKKTNSFYSFIIKTSFDKLEHLYRNIRNKGDIYQLGLSIYLIIIFIIIKHPNEINKIPLSIFKLLIKMIEPNPLKRISIKKLASDYKKYLLT